MADNLTLLDANLAPFTAASDEVGGVQYQQLKLVWGPDGTVNAIDTATPVPVATQSRIVDVTLTLDTSAYASGDLLANTTEIASALRIANGTGFINSIRLLDTDAQNQSIDLVFLNANVSLGTLNATPTISDADAVNVLGVVSLLAGNYSSLGSSSVVMGYPGLGVTSATGTTSIYVGAIIRGAGTYTASGIKLRLHIVTD